MSDSIFDLHPGRFSRSRKIQTRIPEQELVNSFYREIHSLKREISSMEGTYTSLLVYYNGLVREYFSYNS